MQLLPMASSPDGLISARYTVITKAPGREVLTTTSNGNVTQGGGGVPKPGHDPIWRRMSLLVWASLLSSLLRRGCDSRPSDASTRQTKEVTGRRADPRVQPQGRGSAAHNSRSLRLPGT